MDSENSANEWRWQTHVNKITERELRRREGELPGWYWFFNEAYTDKVHLHPTTEMCNAAVPHTPNSLLPLPILVHSLVLGCWKCGISSRCALILHTRLHIQWRRQEFLFVGLWPKPRGLEDGSSPVGPRGEDWSPSSGSGDVPQKLEAKAEAVWRHCLDTLTAETIRI